MARRSPQFVGELAKTLCCSLALTGERKLGAFAGLGESTLNREGRDESRPYIAAGDTRHQGRHAGYWERWAQKEGGVYRRG